jgi:hypothetical protein
MTDTQPQESLETRLRRVLESLSYGDQQVAVESVSPRNVIGVVTTPDFDEMGEAERQRRVWEEVQRNISEEDRARIEFIFTNTPEEEMEMEEQDEDE